MSRDPTPESDVSLAGIAYWLEELVKATKRTPLFIFIPSNVTPEQLKKLAEQVRQAFIEVEDTDA
jgi:hypothetical protein